MPTIDLTKDNFEKTIEESGIILIEIFAPWCGHCRAFSPIFKKISEKYPDVVFAMVNGDVEPDLVEKNKVTGYPTVVVFRDKVEVYNRAGSLPEDKLDELVAKVKGLDMDQVRKSSEGLTA